MTVLAGKYPPICSGSPIVRAWLANSHHFGLMLTDNGRDVWLTFRANGLMLRDQGLLGWLGSPLLRIAWTNCRVELA